MRHLLDSHTLLWYTLADSRLSAAAAALILDSANQVVISAASFWEIAIKVCLGKLTLHRPFETFIDSCVNQHAFTILPIEPSHTAALVSLPFHHKDPFDRPLVVQAMAEGIPLISSDSALDAYGIRRLW